MEAQGNCRSYMRMSAEQPGVGSISKGVNFKSIQKIKDARTSPQWNRACGTDSGRQLSSDVAQNISSRDMGSVRK